MNKKDLIFSYIFLLIIVLIISPLEFPTEWHLPIVVLLFIVFPFLYQRRLKNIKDTYSYKKLYLKFFKIILKYPVTFLYVAIAYVMLFISFSYWIGLNTDNTALVAVTKSPQKANEIQELLTTKHNGTGRIILEHKDNKDVRYGITINKNEYKNAEYVKLVVKLLNSNIVDDSVYFSANIKWSNNAKKNLKNILKQREEIIYNIEGVESVYILTCPDIKKLSEDAKLDHIHIYYNSVDNADIVMIEKKMLSLFNDDSNNPPKIFIQNNSLEKKAYEKYNLAKEEFKNKNYQKALDLIKEAHKIFPVYSADIEKMQKFINLDNKIKKYPKNYKFYIERGDLKNIEQFSMFQKDSDITSDVLGAIEDYSKALELNPKAYEVYEKRGDAWAKLNRSNKPCYKAIRTPEDDNNAIKDYLKAVELMGGNNKLYEKLGDMHKDPHQKLKFYKKCKNKKSENLLIVPTPNSSLEFDKFHHNNVLLKTASCYEKLEQYDEALKVLEDLVEQKLYLQQAYNLRFLYNWRAGYYKKALDSADDCSVWVCKLVGIFF